MLCQHKTPFLGVLFAAAALLSMLCAASVVCDASAKPIDVLDHGAVADGKTDNTAAFQKALDQAGKSGDDVRAPAGVYRFSGHIHVPEGVTVVGSWHGPPGRDKGTVLQVIEGRGKEDGLPFITLEGAAGIQGLVIEYPEQAPDVPNPVPYPWTIRGLAEDCRILNVLLYRSYQAVDLGTYPCSRPFIDGLYGSFLRRGIYIDGSVDVGRISNVHFTGFGFSYKGPMDEYKLKNGEAFIIGKADWMWFDNCFALGVKTGFRFLRGKGGNAKRVGPPNYVQVTRCGIDESDTPLIVEEAAGISFSQCVFKGKASQIRATNTYPVKFSQCNFSPVPGTDSLVEARGRGRVSFMDCTFEFWDTTGIKAPALMADCTSISVQGCEFGTENAPSFKLADGIKRQIELTPSVVSGVISGNRLRYGKSIVNNSKGDVEIFSNVTDDSDPMFDPPAK